MKKFYFSLVGLFVLVAWFGLSFQTAAQSEINQAGENNRVSPNIVISQFQTAGTSATDEFIELHNNSSSSVNLQGFRLVYRSANGTTDVPFIEWTSSTIISPGGYYLIASTFYDDPVAPDITFNPTTCSCSVSAAGGGLAVRSGALNSGVIYDSVGYGTATNAFTEGAPTVAPPVNASQMRKSNGCQDTDNNANDFSTVNPSSPRNSSSSPNLCGGNPGTQLIAGGAANPTTVTPGATTLLTVTVTPATIPPSTGITVTANLNGIGGSANQRFFDDGTNGDATAGDNVFSYLATIPVGAIGGNFTVIATAADAQTRSVNVNINVTVNAPFEIDDHLLLGNPSRATTDIANENNYLMIKPQYALSYNRSRATPNWVSWRLDSTWIGTAPRQDDFRPDPQLPADWYRVTTGDYTGSGYDRGHMVASGDRTRSIPDKSTTFLMTNIIPQLAANNQGAWEDFETYLRTLAQSGQEVYIIAGVHGNIGTISNGRVVIPQYTWKVALVLPNGTNDLQRITKGTRTIGIIMPNFPPLNINATWRQFRVSVDEVENLTGYNFFTNVPKNTQEIIERRKDRQ
ncbi:MAG TPA: DNA/RNA non-specific endonuclease [Pyrinomonadaceae bacterium]|nr:DNA/RNA non-specific endonuclease [Pyrinomonadaceae bacterium]